MMFGWVGRSVLCFARQVIQSVRPISMRLQRLRFVLGHVGAQHELLWMMMKKNFCIIFLGMVFLIDFDLGFD